MEGPSCSRSPTERNSATSAFLQANNIPHLVKPFEVAELIAQARRLLQKAQAAAAGAS
jgi:DNA-binding response OmpR family regulator